MEQVAEIYYVESGEQLRALSGELRQRVLRALADESMTPTQLGERLGQPANKLHYHVRELERVGLVRQVDTRERGGILEKYFRAVAREFTIAPSLLRSLPVDEIRATIESFMQSTTRALLNELNEALRADRSPVAGAQRTYLWVTPQELAKLNESIAALLRPFEEPRDDPEVLEEAVTLITYPVRAAPPEPEAEPDTGDVGKPERLYGAGVIYYNRHDLERLARQGQKVEGTFWGVMVLASDVTPSLVDRTFGRFRLRGVLRAGSDVREALARKEA